MKKVRAKRASSRRVESGAHQRNRLRRLAEKRLKKLKKLKTSVSTPQHAARDGHESKSEHRVDRLAHELSVYQIELEMQNEELRRAQVEADQSRQRYQDLYETVPAGCLTVDRRGTILETNPAAAAMIGHSRSALIGRRFHLFIEEEDRLQFTKFCNAMLRGEKRRACEVRLQHDGQMPFTVIVSGSLIPLGSLGDRKGPILSLVLTNVSELRRANAALRETEQLTRAFWESSVTVAWLKDAEGRYVYISPSFERRFGVRLKDWRGKPDSALWPGEIAKNFRMNDLRVLENNCVLDDLEQAQEPDGSCSWWLSHKFPYVDASGNQHVGGLAVEITDRKIMEKALRESEAKLAAELDDMKRLHQVSTRLAEQKDLQSLLYEVVDAAINITRADMGLVQLRKSNSLHIVAQRGFEQSFLEFFNTVHGEQAVCGTAFRRRERVIVEDVKASPIFIGTPALAVVLAAGVRAVQATPLVNRAGDIVGMLSTQYRKPGRPSERDLRILDLLARQAADLIERAQAEDLLRLQQQELRRSQEELDRHRAKLEGLTAKLLTAQEQERQRIARELHDDVSQRLAALVLDVASLEDQPPVLPELIPKSLEPVREQLELLSDDIHNLAYTLHPSLLVHAGLQPAIEDHIQQVTKRTGLSIHFKVRDVPSSLSLDHATCLFRVMQECLWNTVKHAKATESTVRLSGSSKGVGISVMDNGQGFNSEDRSTQQKGLGLTSMQERMRLMNGFLRVHSRQTGGTKVCAWIPFKEGEP